MFNKATIKSSQLDGKIRHSILGFKSKRSSVIQVVFDFIQFSGPPFHLFITPTPIFFFDYSWLQIFILLVHSV